MASKTGGFTAENLKNTEILNGFQLINKNEKGFEIIDRRPIGERLKSPIISKNIVYCFGVTHFVVTEKYYNKLISN